MLFIFGERASSSADIQDQPLSLAVLNGNGRALVLCLMSLSCMLFENNRPNVGVEINIIVVFSNAS
jgi:hypothetical protein